MVNNIIFLFFSYFFASIPFGLLIGKVFYKKDIRLEGSGNIGATNVWRICGKPAGILTFLLDGLKGAIPVIISKYIFLNPVLPFIVALICILGHIFPVYLKFKGGRGVATMLLILFAINLQLGVFASVVWVMIFLCFGYSSLSSILMCILIVPFAFGLEGVTAILPWFCIIFSTIVILKHKENLKRLLNREEKKMFSKSLFKL